MSILKPTHAEITRLAARETRPEHAARFQHLALGFVPTLFALALIALVSLPWIIARLVQRSVRRRALSGRR